MATRRRKKKTFLPIICILIWLGAISALGCYYIFEAPRESAYSEEENRTLAGFPEVSFSNIFSGDFGTQMENYLLDHSPGRSKIIAATNRLQNLVSFASHEEYLLIAEGPKDLLDTGDYKDLNGKPMEVTYGPNSDTDNWDWMQTLPHLISDFAQATAYFSYTDMNAKSEDEVVKWAFNSEKYIEFYKLINTMVNEDIISKNSLVDNKTTFDEKYNACHYAVLYGGTRPTHPSKLATDETWSYRPVWVEMKSDLSFQAHSGLGTVNTWGIFEDTLSDNQIDQLIHAINYLYSDVGVKNFLWGPKSAGLFTEDANGNRTAEIQFDFDHNPFDHRGHPRVGHHSLIQDIRLLEETEEVTAALATADVTFGQASLQVIERPDVSTNEIVLPGSNVEVASHTLETEDMENIGGDTVGLQRRGDRDKPGNPNPPRWPGDPGEECPGDAAGVKSYKFYQYDDTNRMSSSNEDGVVTNYTYDTMGNLICEQSNCKITDYRYNELNQLTAKNANGRTYLYSYDARGNRIKEIGWRNSQTYNYDETNHMTQGTNWEGTTSHYVYNGLGKRIANTIAKRCNTLYNYEYVVDYTDPESNDLMVYTTKAPNSCLWEFEYYQKHVYANGERIQLATLADEGFDCYPTVYVHEDALGRAHYYSTTCADKFAEMKYDVWGDPDYTSKVVRDGFSDYVYAVFTGHVYDVVLDLYYADARFYDATSRQWMAEDPAKDGLNWYQYCNNNPATYWDPTGLNWFDDAMDWAGEAWAKKGGYFTQFSCDTGHWLDENGELLINGIGYVAAGITAIGLTAAAAPVAIPMIAASLGASSFATLLATVGVYSIAGAGYVTATTGALDVAEAFTGENYVRSTIGSDTYDFIQVSSALYATAGSTYLSQFIVPDTSNNRANSEVDDETTNSESEKPLVRRNQEKGKQYQTEQTKKLEEDPDVTIVGTEVTLKRVDPNTNEIATGKDANTIRVDVLAQVDENGEAQYRIYEMKASADAQFTHNQKDAGYVQGMLNAEYEAVGKKADGLANTRIPAGTIVQRVDPDHPI